MIFFFFWTNLIHLNPDLNGYHFYVFQGLLDVTCKTVANMIKGKTPEDIRKTFNIKNDFTPSEEEQVRKENEWCEEK